MRESEMAERYAQRAIDKRRELEARQRGERRLGDYALTAYLAEGEHLDQGLRNIPDLKSGIDSSCRTVS